VEIELKFGSWWGDCKSATSGPFSSRKKRSLFRIVVITASSLLFDAEELCSDLLIEVLLKTLL